MLLLAATAGCSCLCGGGSTAKNGVRISELPDRVRIEINGELFSEYFYKDVSRPYLYPILSASGQKMTRHWPMEQFPDEEHDHPHHRSFWFAHGSINGVDFWSEEPKAGKTVHQKFTTIKSGRDMGVIQSQNKMVSLEGKVIATDDRTLKVYNRPGVRLFDYEVTIHASEGDLVLGDTKEGTMAIRLAETMRLKGKVGKGHIVNSEGVRDGETWGKRAKWVDYHGPVDGQTLGVAIFDNPRNPRYPTWWHVRDYGLFAANPFGLHEFEKQPAGAGNMTVKAGDSVTFRYRFYIHPGDEREGKVAERFGEY
ncbi:MAG TPA: PmoA family protein, partial [Verrucomicrobiae bacterium]|nr:PmoA family protein [Verrucomicrobiae bacterium]